MIQNYLSRELDVAIDASSRAEELVMRYYRGDIAAEKKADATPVTIADREAEALIKEMLHKHFPHYGFLGEESGKAASSDDTVWVVDPIDGTKNFIRHIPLFGILIGLMKKGVCTLGVSNVPGMQEKLWGKLGVGAFMNGVPIQVSDVATLQESTVSLGGMKKLVAMNGERGLKTLIEQAARIRAFGDTYPYNLVASGRLEAVVEVGIKIWDIAALVAIIEAAGGKCTDIDGKPITTETTSIIASNGKVHEEIVQLFR
ncbi:MAG: inositol monophosphatase family protein [Patescibacteria group bacterium]